MASISSSTSQWKYDVFLSFRGGDTCNGFANRLFDVLCRNRIVTSKDECQDGGEDVSPDLLRIIEESCVSIIIFSENYAYSRWCLDELVKIIDCKNGKGQTVIPIFYKVDQSDVRELKGSFGDAFVKHKNEFKDSLAKVETWSQALKQITEILGFVSWNIRHETNLIEEIVNHILEALSDAFSSCSYDGLGGIDSRVKDIESLLQIESTDVLFLGIWGMGGIGKSTIARKVFDQISPLFEGRCLVANVREKLERYTLDYLQQEIISKILGKKGLNLGIPLMLSSSIRQRIKRKKVLIVLDDVTDLMQIEYLIGECSIYGPGSRVVLTSKDKQILLNGGAQIYEVQKLNFHEALHLFSLHAFKRSSPPEAYMKLATRALNYAQGIPLALKVLGSSLYNQRMGQWEDKFKKLEGLSDKNVEKILRISYDELDEDEKDIFLDVACFFKSEDKDLVESILSANGFCSTIGLIRLLDKSLISISEDVLDISKKHLDMHDLLQQMGRDIVRRECIEEPGKRSRLWIAEDIFQVLTKDVGTISVEGIALDVLKIGDMDLSSTAFMRMHKLQFLKLYHPYYMKTENYVPCSGKINVHLSRGLEFLPDKLKFLYWYQYPSKSLPLNFCPKNLVQLHLIYSHVEQLFNGDQYLENLKFMDLSYSFNLIEIPDLSKLPKLEILCLKGCTSLIEICSAIQYDSNLTNVDLGYCKNLCSFLSFLQLKKLNFLSLKGCSKLTYLPKIPPTIKCLVLDEISIEQVPLSMGHCFGLATLELKSCRRLESLPHSIGELQRLERLDLEGCSKLIDLPESICNLKSLKSLVVKGCQNLNELPENLGNLESLGRLDAAESGIKKLPSSINRLAKLTFLSCDGCKGLKLPPLTAGLSRLRIFSLKNCGMLEISSSFGSLVSLVRLYLSGNDLEALPEGIGQLPRLHRLDLRNCGRLKCVPDLTSALEYLFVRNCTSLESLSFAQRNKDSLRSLDAANCPNLDQKTCREIIDDVLLRHEPRLDEEFLDNGKELQVNFGRGFNIIGNEVPPEMRYQNSSGSSLSFPLGLESCHIISLAFCAVVAPIDYRTRQFRLVGCKCSFVAKSGHTFDFQSEDIICIRDMTFRSEHVFFWFSTVQLNYKYTITNASFQFYIADEGGYSSELIKRCGVHLLNDENDIDVLSFEDGNTQVKCH